MPSQAELDAQNNASRARQQARRGIEQSAPQVQQPYVNPYGGQYGTDSIQDQSYYDNYYDTSGDGYYDDDGYYQSGYSYEDEGMTDEEWNAYLAGLEEGQGSQGEPSYYSDYGSRMPDGPIEAPYQEESSWMDNLSFGADKFRGETPFQQPDWFQGPINRVSNDLNQFSNAQQEPEAETPFLQYLQENTEQPQGGGSNQMEQGESNEYGNSPQRNYYNFVQGGGQMNDEQLRQANEMAMSMGTTFDPETGYSSQPYQDYQEQGPQVQAPMSISDTRGMLQERFGSPTISGLSQNNQDSQNFYDDESMRRDQRIENRPDFNEVTRDIDKYDDRRTFAEARRLVPTERDKTGKITNREKQRAAMTLTEREVQDKKRNEYNEEYRERNLEVLQQRIDKGNEPSSSKQDKRESEVAEQMAFFFEENPNFPQEAMEPMRADMMRFPLPPGVDSHLQLWADNNGYDLEELYQQLNQENNGEGGAAPVQQRSPSPAANSKGMKKPPQEAIDDLRSNPSRASEFDQYFGQGSSAKFL